MDRNIGNRIAIVRAMSELIEHDPLDKITIPMICERAQLSKATFYRLFPSKYDVIQWMMGIYSRVGLDEIGRTLTWHEGLCRTTYGLDKHSKLLLAANTTKQFFEAPREFAFAKRRDTIIETIQLWHHVEVTPLLAFQAQSYARISAIIASEWHRGFYPYSEEEYVVMLESIVPRELHDLLDHPVFPEGGSNQLPIPDLHLKDYRAAKAMLDVLSEE